MGHQIIDECVEAIESAIDSALECDCQSRDAVATVDTNDGYIDLYCNTDGNTADVIHDDDREHNSSTLEKQIADAMPDFGEYAEQWMDDNTSDYWDDHGFRDEADYNRWKYGI